MLHHFWFEVCDWFECLIMAVYTARRIFQISVEPISGKKVEHNGIKVELLGQIGMYILLYSSL